MRRFINSNSEVAYISLLLLSGDTIIQWKLFLIEPG
jgi:hypothetical protein